MVVIIRLVSAIFTLLNWLIIIRVIISWLRPTQVDPRWRKILAFIYQVTEPILGPIRRLLPVGRMGIDFSPLVALLALMIIRNFVLGLLRGLIYGI